MAKINFMQSPMFDYFREQEKYWEKEGVTAGSLNDASNNDLTEIFIKDLKFRCAFPKKNEARPLRNIIILVQSEAGSGSGKSQVGIAIAKIIERINKKNISVKDNIFFSTSIVNEKLEQLGKAKSKGFTVIYDEQRRSEQFGTGGLSEMSRLSDICDVSRAWGLNIIAIGVPLEFTFIQFNPHYKIFAETIDFENKLNFSLIKCNKDYWRGFIITPLYDNKKFQKEYSEKKDDFIYKNLLGKMKDRLIIRKKRIKELKKNKEFLLCKTKPDKNYVFDECFGAEIPHEERDTIISRAVFELKKEGVIVEKPKKP